MNPTVIISMLLCMLLVRVFSASNHYLSREDLLQKLERQKLLQNEATDENLGNEFLNSLLDEFVQQELEPEIEKEDALVNELDLSTLKELEALEEEIAEEDGRWLDAAADIDGDDLPANYHNSTEMKTKIDGNDVDVKEAIDKFTGDNGKFNAFEESVESVPEKKDEPLFSCSIDEPCPNDQYCLETEFTSICLTCQGLGSGCVDDAQCCSSDGSLPLCVSGMCRSGVKLGSEGTICDTSDDCLDGFCCAETLDFPRKLCRRYSRLEERCSPISEYEKATGLAYSSNYFCPCEGGLSCESKPISPSNQNPLSFIQNHFCMPSNSQNFDFDLPESQTDDSEAPISDAKIARLFTRLWQSRAETEEDQRFNPPSQLLHHGFKESETYSTQNKPSM